MLRLEKVATPETATAVPPDSVPPPGFEPITNVTVPTKLVAVFPSASSAVTLTAGVITAPAAVVLGGTVYTKCVAGPPLMLKALLVLLILPDVTSNRYPVPTLSILRLLNVDTPATALTAVAPDSVPPPGFTPIDIVILPVKAVTVFPAASCADTSTGGAMIDPALVVVGWTVNTSWETGPMRMSKGALVIVDSPLVLAVRV